MQVEICTYNLVTFYFLIVGFYSPHDTPGVLITPHLFLNSILFLGFTARVLNLSYNAGSTQINISYYSQQ